MSDLHVIFGTGPVGRAVMRELLARGKKVRVINQSGGGTFPSAVELRSGDAADPRRHDGYVEWRAVLLFFSDVPTSRRGHSRFCDRSSSWFGRALVPPPHT